MELKRFKIFVDKLNALRDRTDKLYKLKMDIINFEDEYWSLIWEMFEQHYGSEGLDIFQWWLYEDGDKRIFETDTNKVNANLTTILNLWKYLEEIREKGVVVNPPKKPMTDKERKAMLKQMVEGFAK